jgi:hypothetical protein
MRRIYKRIMFKIHMWMLKKTVVRARSLFSYPVLCDLEFNELKYWDRYYKRGIPVNKTATIFLNAMNRRFQRDLKPLNKKVSRRLEQYLSYKRNSEFVDSMFRDYADLKLV